MVRILLSWKIFSKFYNMRKYILENPSIVLYLVFCSLALGIVRVTLSFYDVVEADTLLSSTIRYVSGAMLVAGILLKLYKAKQLGSFRPFMIRLAICVAIVVIMLLAKFIHTSSLLSDIF